MCAMALCQAAFHKSSAHNLHCLTKFDYRQEDTSACSASQGCGGVQMLCAYSVLLNLVEAPVLSLEHASEDNQMCLLVS